MRIVYYTSQCRLYRQSVALTMQPMSVNRVFRLLSPVLIIPPESVKLIIPPKSLLPQQKRGRTFPALEIRRRVKWQVSASSVNPSFIIHIQFRRPLALLCAASRMSLHNGCNHISIARLPSQKRLRVWVKGPLGMVRLPGLPSQKRLPVWVKGPPPRR